MIASETKSQIDQIKEAELRVLTEASGQSWQRYLTSQPKQKRTKPERAVWGSNRRKWCSESGCEVDRGHSEKGLALGVMADLRIRSVVLRIADSASFVFAYPPG